MVRAPVGRGAATSPVALLLSLLVALCRASGPAEPVDFVNLLAGSFTKGDVFSTGNTLPLVGRPWGFNHWALQTNNGQTAWWFNGNDHEYHWIRCTHQPSPWIGDYGWFLMGPQMGDPYASNPTGFFEPRAAELRPHKMSFTTAPDGMLIELAPTMHGAVLRTTFPRERRIAKRICFKLGGGSSDGMSVGSSKKEGWKAVNAKTTRYSGGTGRDFGHFLHVESTGVVEEHGRDFCFSFGQDAEVGEIWIATSFISFAQAEHNFAVELSDKQDYEAVEEESRQEWNGLLSRATPSSTLDGGLTYDPLRFSEAADFRDVSVFYTGLYRGLTFPRRIDEPDPDDALNTIHWSPYATSGPRVRSGVLVTDNGFWDTFRTVYPMLSLIYPDHLGWIVQGWVNAYSEGGWLPKWASPGYRQSMVGTYGDVVLADAIVKNIGGFDRATAFEALKKDAYDPHTEHGGACGKVGLDVYEKYGYLPYDGGVSDSVSRTLDFAHADWATANAADVLGDLQGDSARLRSRAEKAMENLFESKSGLMKPKGKRGEWRPNSGTRWGDGYTEGSAWHHSFPPWDIEKLANLHGGKANLISKLKEMLSIPSNFEAGGYGSTIHEMREMRALAMGQYGHNNQPSHHVLFLFALAGDRNATNRLVRQTIRRAYGTDFYSGDEDNGEMGSWFVLAAIGLYAAAPGSEDYVLTTPLFDKMTLTIPTASSSTSSPQFLTLEIYAHRNGKEVTDVEEVRWGTIVLDAPTIRYSALRKGGELHFVTKGASIPRRQISSPPPKAAAEEDLHTPLKFERPAAPVQHAPLRPEEELRASTLRAAQGREKLVVPCPIVEKVVTASLEATPKNAFYLYFGIGAALFMFGRLTTAGAPAASSSRSKHRSSRKRDMHIV